MATINDVSFNMQNISIVSDHRNVMTDQPGADENFITDMGYDGLVIRIEGFETSLATYDNVMAEFMGAGTQTLVPYTGYQFSIYSVQKTNEHLEGFTTNYYPYDLILYTSTPYRESTTLSCRAKEITSNNQTWTAEDAPCNNLVSNWNFETWTAGASSAPDFWTMSGAGASIARNDTDEKYGTYCAALTYGSAETQIYQHLKPEPYQGSTVTFGCWVKTSTASQTRVQIYDGVDAALSSNHTGGGDYEFLECSLDIDPAATAMFVYVVTSVAGTAYIDGAYLVEASSIADSTFTREITTSGNVDAIPDIKVMGGAVSSSFNRTSGYSGTNTDATEYTTTSTSYVLKQTYTYSADANKAYTLDSTSMYLKTGSSAYDIYGKVTYQAASLNGGAETTVVTNITDSESYIVDEDTGLSIDAAGNEDLVIRFYMKTSNITATAYMKNIECVVSTRRKDVCKNPQVYNTADTDVKMDVANEVEPDMTIRVNTDGTGALEYIDDFTTTKYLDAAWVKSGTTYDSANDELDFGNSEYIVYKVDTKYPITGVPTLTSTIDIDSGTPSIKISSDDSTYYDIDTAIVDNTYTEYPLNSDGNLSLKGLTTFYWKLNFDGSSTGSLVLFKLNAAMSTIDAEHPRITTGGSASTLKCDQHADSGLNCTVSVHYRDRSWA